MRVYTCSTRNQNASADAKYLKTHFNGVHYNIITYVYTIRAHTTHRAIYLSAHIIVIYRGRRAAVRILCACILQYIIIIYCTV